MDDPGILLAASGKYRVSGFDPVEAATWVEGDFLEQGLAFYVARRLTIRKSLPKAAHIETAVKYLVSDDEGNILGEGFESYHPGSRHIQPLSDEERRRSLEFCRANPLIVSNAWKVCLHPSQLSNLGRCIMHRRHLRQLTTDHALAQVPHLMDQVNLVCEKLWNAIRVDFEGVMDTAVNRMQIIPRYEKQICFADREFFDANFPGHYAPVCPTIVQVDVLKHIRSTLKYGLDSL
jgi:hypothetical protein